MCAFSSSRRWICPRFFLSSWTKMPLCTGSQCDRGFIYFFKPTMSNKNQLLCCIWFEQSVSQRLKSSLTMNYKYELGAGFPTNCWEKVKHKVKCNQKENGQVKSWKSQRTWENHVGRKNDSLPPFLNYKHHENRAVFKSIIVTVII